MIDPVNPSKTDYWLKVTDRRFGYSFHEDPWSDQKVPLLDDDCSA